MSWKREKEIGKLITLLNSYEDYKEKETEIRNYKWEYKYNSYICAERVVDGAFIGEDESRAIIISKGYNFIPRLVEHHKLLHPDFVFHLKLDFGDSMPESNFYLMMLAISENPIDELCKMLRP